MSRFTRPAVWILVIAAPCAAADKPAGYPFAVPPLTALDQLGKLPGESEAPTAAERNVLASAWERAGQSAKDRAVSKSSDVLLTRR